MKEDAMTSASPIFRKEINSLPSLRNSMRALILDDSEVDRSRLRRVCAQAELDMEFSQAATIAEFSAKLDGPVFDIVFLDYQLMQGDGLIALQMLKRHPSQKRSAAIMVAGEGQIQVAIDAMKNGCSDFIVKDNLAPDMLFRAVNNAVEKSSLRTALTEEEDMRAAMQRSLARFAKSCGSEMRTILSSMLRRTRAMRKHAAGGAAPSPEDFQGVEQSCERLWDFLEEFHAFVEDASEQKEPVLN